MVLQGNVHLAVYSPTFMQIGRHWNSSSWVGAWNVFSYKITIKGDFVEFKMLLLVTYEYRMSLIPWVKGTLVNWPRNQAYFASLLLVFLRENEIKALSNQYTNLGNTIQSLAGAACCFSFIASMQRLMWPGFKLHCTATYSA